MVVHERERERLIKSINYFHTVEKKNFPDRVIYHLLIGFELFLFQLLHGPPRNSVLYLFT